ncbi:MAG: hypothetical protein U1E71_08455 [Ramlibacter sp.]|jgi:hypothetical protein
MNFNCRERVNYGIGGTFGGGSTSTKDALAGAPSSALGARRSACS